LPDPRTGNPKRHDLLEMLTIALTATVWGAESRSDFAMDREDLFLEFLRLENGRPSHDTFSRLFRRLGSRGLRRLLWPLSGRLRRARPDISVRRERKRSGWSNDFARSILGQMR
jgi:hypothetical protein